MKLFLFDLDGTLVTTGGAGLRALGRAFKELHGIDDAIKAINPSGKTDPAIFREMGQLHLQRNITPQEMIEMAETYLRFLQQEMDTSTRKGPLTGVLEFVDHLSSRGDVVLALGTGNLERGARLKLAPMNLNPYFEIGGFGSDSEDRAELLKFGHRRAETRANRPIPASSVFVIGDTALDVSAARRAGFHAVAVASGSVPYDTLAAAQPDYLWHDMREGFDFLKKLTDTWERAAS